MYIKSKIIKNSKEAAHSQIISWTLRRGVLTGNAAGAASVSDTRLPLTNRRSVLTPYGVQVYRVT